MDRLKVRGEREREGREGDRISSPGSKLVVVSRAARRNERLNEREIGGDGDGSNFVRGGGGGSGWEKYSLLVKVDAGKKEEAKSFYPKVKCNVIQNCFIESKNECNVPVSSKI